MSNINELVARAICCPRGVCLYTDGAFSVCEAHLFSKEALAALAACSDHLITVAGNAADVEGTRSQRHYWAYFFAAELTKKEVVWPNEEACTNT